MTSAHQAPVAQESLFKADAEARALQHTSQQRSWIGAHMRRIEPEDLRDNCQILGIRSYQQEYSTWLERAIAESYQFQRLIVSKMLDDVTAEDPTKLELGFR